MEVSRKWGRATLALRSQESPRPDTQLDTASQELSCVARAGTGVRNGRVCVW